MSSSPDDLRSARIVTYLAKVAAAHDFARGAEGDAWNGLFLMGLAMNNLDLIPFASDINPRGYWKTAPEPKGESKDWEVSWIVERDAFSEVTQDEH